MLLATPAIILTAAVTVLAALICQWTAIRVGRVRRLVKIDSPAMTGAPELERALRVQGNTVEQIVLFLPLLWVAALYFHATGWLVPGLGLIWCLGRIWYAVSYMASPQNRHLAFGLCALVSLALAVLGIIGLVQAWTVV